MKLWARLKAAVTGAMHFPRQASWFFGWSDVTRSQSASSVGDGLESNVLTSPLLWIGRTFPEARLVVRREQRDGKTKVDRSPEMARLIRKPNPFYSGDALWMATLLSFGTEGTAYWKKVRVGRQVKELHYLPHWMVEPVGSTTSYVDYYEYNPGTGAERIKPEDIVVFKYGLDPRDIRKGFAPLRPVINEVFSDDEAQRLVAALLRNRGIPGLVISPEKDVVVDDQMAQSMKDYVDSMFSADKRGKPLVVKGATKVSTFGFSPAELDLSGLRNIPEERVCAALGVRASVVGFGTGLESTKVGATMKEEVRLSWTGCLIPIGRMMAADLTNQLLPDFDRDPRAEAAFDVSEVEAMQPDRLSAAQAAEVEVRAGIATRGEVRQRLGYEVTDADDVFYIPFSAAETPRDARVEDEPERPAPEAPKAAKRLTRQQARILRAQDALRKRREEAFEGKVRRFLEEIGQASAAAHRAYGKDASDDLRIEHILAAVNPAKRKSDLRGLLGREYYAIHNEQVKVLTELGLSIGAPDTLAVQMLAAGSARADKMDLFGKAKERMREVLAAAREEGLGVDETARRLADVVPAGRYTSPGARAQVIARTEVREAQTQSALATYRSMEGVTRAMLIDGRLGAGVSDEECMNLDGTEMSFDEARQMLAAEHPNGTRDVLPVFQEA